MGEGIGIEQRLISYRHGNSRSFRAAWWVLSEKKESRGLGH